MQAETRTDLTMRIALLEGDISQTELLTHWLRSAGHHIRALVQVADLLNALKHESFDAVLLDWNLPELSGIDVLRELRGRLHSTIPVILYTARDQEDDVVRALRAGADDYLVKPARRMELLARLEAVTRRGRGVRLESQVFEVGVFRVDYQTRRITRGNEPVQLTAKEFDLAALMLRNVGQLLSRQYLHRAIWAREVVLSSRTLDTHVSWVRNKLKLTPEYGWSLRAVYGYGYRLQQFIASASRSREEEPKVH
jgi:two-component system, OmpR family, response regulator RegX3